MAEIIAVGVIVATAAIYTGRSLYRSVTGRRKPCDSENDCGNCCSEDSGCEKTQ